MYFEIGSLERQLRYNKVIWVALLQCDWCACRKRKLGHRNTQREDHVHTQGEDGAKERA